MQTGAPESGGSSMRRFVCAALAVLALLPAWPVLAKGDDDDEGADVEEQDKSQAKDQDQEEAKEPGDTNEDANRPGFYLGIAGTWGLEKFQDTNNIHVDDSIGFNAR